MIIIKRNTIQRTLVLETVRSLSNHPTADEIYNIVLSKCPTISKGTVYRNLTELSTSGEIKRIEIPNGADRFDKTIQPHSHMRCLMCDSVYDCMGLRVDSSHAYLDGFKPLGYDILVNGYCRECQKKIES